MLHCFNGGKPQVFSPVNFLSLPVDVFTKPENETCRKFFSLPHSKRKLRSKAAEKYRQEQVTRPVQTFALQQTSQVKQAKPKFPLVPNEAGLFEVKGTIILERKDILGLDDNLAKVCDYASELVLGKRIQLQLVSLDEYPGTGEQKASKIANLEGWSLTADEGTSYSVNFALESNFGLPGALLVSNQHPNEFYLKTVTLEMPGNTKIHFNCNSWIYNEKTYDAPRIFVSNQVYLPKDTPAGLRKLRISELNQLRGDGTGEREDSDRQYDYDVYNDLGNPDKNASLVRPILGGSKEYPYPRRCRTGRKRTESDPASERPPSLLEDVYVPRDEKFSRTKSLDFLSSAIKSFVQDILPTIDDFLERNDDFKSIDDIRELYRTGLKLKKRNKVISRLAQLSASRPGLLDVVQETASMMTGTVKLTYPIPQVMKDNEYAWMLDEEFAREMIAGLNPMIIERLETFPPVSKLDEKKYGSPISAITEDHILPNLEGLGVAQALEQNKLFILDYHDVYLPYVERINALEGSKTYASRTILFLTGEGTLKPVAIELSLPASGGSQGGCRRRVLGRPGREQADWVWDIAKAHVRINNAGYHQLISHWLRTHACLEPFIIATKRQLSALHPVHALLTPHFKDTMNINALARKSLINGQGIIENNFTPAQYSMEMSSAVYKSWRFDKQGLPADLIARGMAIKDETAKHGLKLMIQDYPYAVDGLDIWFAIQSWVEEYIQIYYQNDKMVEEDTELQSWWEEIKEKGHGDKRDEPWWFKMKSIRDLEEAVTIFMWLASAHHAAVNFGQYAYGGLPTNSPTRGRKLIPEIGEIVYWKFLENPTGFYLQTIPQVPQAAIVMSTLQILSQHASEEEYLGERPNNWTDNERVNKAFLKFSTKLKKIEEDIKQRNNDQDLKNRHGPVKVPYTLLFPTSKKGMTGQGVPNSTSI